MYVGKVKIFVNSYSASLQAFFHWLIFPIWLHVPVERSMKNWCLFSYQNMDIILVTKFGSMIKMIKKGFSVHTRPFLFSFNLKYLRSYGQCLKYSNTCIGMKEKHLI